MINGKKSLFYTVLMAGALMSCGGPKQAPSEEVAKSGNPVFEGWYADPEGIIYGDTYWIYPTTRDLYEKQTFFDCFSSKDLVNWTKHTAILDTAEVKWAKIAMWAPSVINKDGKYYLFFGANDVHEGEIGGIGVAVSDRPEGPYKDLLGKPLINEIVNGAQPIDQFVFHDADNDEYYMYYGGWKHCNMVRLNKDFTGLIPFEDGTIYKEVTPKDYVEGPFMFKKNGKYTSCGVRVVGPDRITRSLTPSPILLLARSIVSGRSCGKISIWQTERVTTRSCMCRIRKITTSCTIAGRPGSRHVTTGRLVSRR